ncbi:hypothetical protein NKH77_05690 [Streptomyces sp. M19]
MSRFVELGSGGALTAAARQAADPRRPRPSSPSAPLPMTRPTELTGPTR